jgi:hypothetical protein
LYDWRKIWQIKPVRIDRPGHASRKRERKRSEYYKYNGLLFDSDFALMVISDDIMDV